MLSSLPKSLLLVIGLAISLVANTQALAQFALGSGEALDPGGVYRDWGHNLDGSSQRNSGGLNFSASQQDFSTRMITNPGRVWSGRSWNSTLGHDFSRDYRTPIFTSTQANPAIRNPVLRDSYNAYYRQTPGWSSVVRSAGFDRYQTDAPSPAQLKMDQRNLLQSELRASHTLGQAKMVGLSEAGTDEIHSIRASPLRGLLLTPASVDMQQLGLTSFDEARLREDLDRGRFIPNRAGRSEIDFANIGRRPAPNAERRSALSSTGPVNGLIPSSPHDSILETMASRYASGSGEEISPYQLSTLSDTYASYQQELSMGVVQTDLQGNVLANEGDETAMGEEEASEDGAEEESPIVAKSRLDRALRHDATLKNFSAPDSEDRFNELLAAGEERLRTGQYFWAEKRFSRALQLLPNNPLAAAGLAQSQIGAGLYLTASNTLKRMMRKHPEMIDVNLGDNLMPAKETLFNAVDVLRNRISHGGPDAADYGLLLAFIGHQLNEQRTIDEGLAAIKKANPESALLPALQRIWGDASMQKESPAIDSANE
jgi:tetratricopeptide (TPR) repeat protein